MDVLREKCAGLDVHRSVIVACVLVSAAGGRITKEVQSFAAIASGLAELAAWLSGFGVSHVGMEGTGVYWMPVYAALEAVGGITPIVANARHIKAVPGRKTDVIDAEWIAKLIRYGLVRASFVPPQADPGPARSHPLSPHPGRRAVLGAAPPDQAAGSGRHEAGRGAQRRVRCQRAGYPARADRRHEHPRADGGAGQGDRPQEDRAADRGPGRATGRAPAVHAASPVAPDRGHRTADRPARPADRGAVAALPCPDRAADQHPGDRPGRCRCHPGRDRTRHVRLRHAGHLAAWAGVCPGNNESAGKKKAAAARTGNRHLKTALCNAAIAASRKKGSYFKAKYYSLKSRIGGGKAALAIGHKLLTCIWHMLSDGCFYRDLGETYLDRRNQQQTLKRYARKLDALGFTIVPKQETVAMAA